MIPRKEKHQLFQPIHFILQFLRLLLYCGFQMPHFSYHLALSNMLYNLLVFIVYHFPL